MQIHVTMPALRMGLVSDAEASEYSVRGVALQGVLPG